LFNNIKRALPIINERGVSVKTIIVILLITSFTIAKVDLISISPNSWIVFDEGKSSNEALYFNKLPVEGYFSINKFKAYVSLPLAYSVDGATTESQFGLGDITWYVGWQFGSIQPRLGMVVPGVYSLNETWIGSQDIRLGIGVAVQPHYIKTHGGIFSFEASWFPYFSSEQGLAKAGSWDFTSITKGSYYFVNGVRMSGELLFNVNSVEWEWTRPERELKISAVPVVSGSYLFNYQFELGIKAGFGPTYGKIGNETMDFQGTNLSLGLFSIFHL